jgi:hypothetical protein
VVLASPIRAQRIVAREAIGILVLKLQRLGERVVQI